MNEKVKAFIDKQKKRREIQKQIDRIRGEQAWEEYKYQGSEGATQEELNKITKVYNDRITPLEEALKTL